MYELPALGLFTAMVMATQGSHVAFTEAVARLEAQPGAREVQVERVKFLRYGEARGDYDQVVATLNASDPHGK